MEDVNRLVVVVLVLFIVLFSGCKKKTGAENPTQTPQTIPTKEPTPTQEPIICTEEEEFGYDRLVRNELIFTQGGEQVGPGRLDYCKEGKLVEVYCDSSSPEGFSKETIDCECFDGTCQDDCNHKCKTGVCVEGECFPYSCSDTEDGNPVPNIYGEITLEWIPTWEENEQRFEVIPDECYSKTTVRDYFCTKDGQQDYIDIECIENTECLRTLGTCGVTDKDMDGIPDNQDKCTFRTSVGDPINQEYGETYGCSCNDQFIYLDLEKAFVTTLGENQEFTQVDCENLMSLSGDCKVDGKEYPPSCCNGILDQIAKKETTSFPIGEALADCGGPCKPCTGSYCKNIVKAENAVDVMFIPIGYHPKYPDIQNEVWVEKAAIEAYNLATTPPFCTSAEINQVLNSPADTSFLDETKCGGQAIIGGQFLKRKDYGMVVEKPGEDFEPKFNIYRLDLFGVEPILEKYRGSRQLGALVETASTWTYNSFCSDSEFKLFYYFIYGNLDQSNVVHPYNAVIYDNREIKATKEAPNPITHETGHSFCFLADEYRFGGEGFFGFAPNVDDAPEICDLNSDGTVDEVTCRSKTEEDQCGEEGTICICKWDERHSQHSEYVSEWKKWFETDNQYDFQSAGCIEGGYGESQCKPEYDSAVWTIDPADKFSVSYDDSMMEGFFRVGPGKYGLGTWNRVGYVACKEQIDKYTS